MESVSFVGRTTKPEHLHPAFRDGELPDVYIAMGETAENVAERFHISREAMDAFALDSHRKAIAAQESGVLGASIVAVQTPAGAIVDVDDGPRRDSSIERLSSLKPVFRESGVVTAGNSCPLNDGGRRDSDI